MIKARNINKSIRGNSILEDISIHLKKGEINILFGPSGSGKTTLCRNLALLDYPDFGELEVLGHSFKFPLQATPIELPYPKIGFVYQQLFLWPHLTNRENIFLALGNNSSKYFEYYNQLIELLEISELMERFPNEISIGQKQRVAIARTLILKPEFIFLDEITSALDIVQTKRIKGLLIELRKKEHRHITHYA